MQDDPMSDLQPAPRIFDASLAAVSCATPVIAAIGPATATGLQAVILASLPESLLHPMMAQQAKMCDLGWFRTMVDGGLLDVTPKLEKVDGEGDMMKLCADWSCRVVAMTSFTEHVTIKTPYQRQPPHGFGDMQVSQAGEEFKEVFLRASLCVAASYTKIIAHPEHAKLHEPSRTDPGMSDAVDPELAITRFMLAAVMLDMPQALQLLRAVCPVAMDLFIPFHRLSPAFGGTMVKHNVPSVLVSCTILFFALQLKRKKCVKVLMENRPERPPALVLSRFEPGSKDKEEKTVFIEKIHHYFHLNFDPEDFSQLLTLTMQSKDHHEDAFDAAVFALHLNDGMRTYAPAFLAAGAYGRDPVWAIQLALHYGCREVIDHYKDCVAFNDIYQTHHEDFRLHQLIFGASFGAKRVENRHFYQEAIHLMMNLAERDGQSDVVFKTFIVGTGFPESEIQPVFALAKEGLDSVLIRYLDHGFDPSLKANPQSPAFIDQVEAVSPHAAHVIRTHQARKKSKAILSLIHSQPDYFLANPN